MTTERAKLKPGWAFRQAKPQINNNLTGRRPGKTLNVFFAFTSRLTYRCARLIGLF
jgi:hypothetical protein